MKANREVARREPPAAGLAACLYRSTDIVLCSHIKTKNVQLRTLHNPPFTGYCKVPFAGLVPNDSAHIFSGILTVYPIKGQSIM